LSWENITFGSICNLVNGKAFQPSDWSTSGVPIIRIQNLNEADKPFNYWAGSFENQVLVKAGDLLLAWSGTPGTSFGAHIWYGPDSVLNQHIFRCDIDRKRVTPEWVKFAVNVQLNQLIQLSHGGVGLKHVTRKVVEELKIPLPSLEEQKRITDILDRAEALRAKRRAVLAQLDELTQAIFIEMFGDPVINPLGWNTKKLEKLCVKIFGGGTPSKSRQEYYEGNIPWVTPKDMKLDFIQDSIDHISAQAVEESSTRLIPPNSLLMVIRSGILKKKLPVAINICEVTMNQDMKGFLFDNRLTNSYFMLYFFKIYQRDLLNRVRSVTADNLEFDQIKDINVIIPPIDKQQKFALRVAAVGKLKATHKASLAELDELFASLQYRAFRGEL